MFFELVPIVAEMINALSTDLIFFVVVIENLDHKMLELIVMIYFFSVDFENYAASLYAPHFIFSTTISSHHCFFGSKVEPVYLAVNGLDPEDVPSADLFGIGIGMGMLCIGWKFYCGGPLD